MLIIFSGLPGVGKTSLARALAVKIKAALLRIDSLEQALVESGLAGRSQDIGPAGYMAAYALAADNIKIGLTVISDSVNPFAITREAWREVALKNNSGYLEIEVVCSDAAEHRRRLETRQADIPGFVLPTWEDVLNREYHPWKRERLLLDTAQLSIDQALEIILDRLQSKGAEIRLPKARSES